MIDLQSPEVQAFLVANHYKQRIPYLADHPPVQELYELNKVLSDGKVYTCSWNITPEMPVEKARELSLKQMEDWEKSL
jgi:hypothetical protein